MTKAVSLSLGFIFLLASGASLSAQSSATDVAVNEGVVRQANTLVLRQKLAEARNAAASGDLPAAAKYYEDSYTLVQQIGSGIDPETQQTIAGLSSTRLQLARQDQGNGDLIAANTEVNRVLKVDPRNPAAIAFKKQNDQMMVAARGTTPDAQTLEKIPGIMNEKTDAATLVQDGKLLYEMGKLEEADQKFKAALKLDPNNVGAYYYYSLTKQARYAREEKLHDAASGERLVQVEQAWEHVGPNTSLPTPNAFATTNLIYTGPGRQTIVSKLDRIHMDAFYDGLPLSEVVRSLSEQAKIRDPEKKGINFLINPNPDNSVSTLSPTAGGGFGGGFPGAGAPGAPTVDPATGLPVAPAGGGGAESVDLNSVIIKINPGLSDVRLADVLEAVCQVADHPIKYSVVDYAVVFSAKGAETPTLYSRHFRVDPNTFIQGLQAVSALSFGSATSSGSSGGSSGGGGGGGGGSSGGGGQNGQNNGAVVPIVNVAPNSGNLRQSNGGGGGGGGGNRGGGGTAGGAGGAGGLNNNSDGGLNYVTTVGQTVDISTQARLFFSTLGVNLDSSTPGGLGKSIFFNDRLGELFVRATAQDLDTIENAIEVLNRVAPQIHIKSRFIEILQNDSTALGFDWYLGNYVNGKVIANGGSAPSLTTPVSPANPLGTFPGNTPASQIPGSANDQLVTQGLRNPLNAPALTTVTGILTDPNFRVVIHALEQRDGAETLAEPEVVTTSGRQTQMRATQLIFVVTGYDFQQGTAATTTTGTAQ